MLLRLLVSMVLAFIIEYVLFVTIAKIFEWRFFKQSDAIFLLYEYIYPMIEDNFNSNNIMRVSARYEYCGCKIKFRNALEASLKFEILVQKALKKYYVAKYFIEAINPDYTDWNMEDCKEQLEEYCLELRMLINKKAPKE